MKPCLGTEAVFGIRTSLHLTPRHPLRSMPPVTLASRSTRCTARDGPDTATAPGPYPAPPRAASPLEPRLAAQEKALLAARRRLLQVRQRLVQVRERNLALTRRHRELLVARRQRWYGGSEAE